MYGNLEVRSFQVEGLEIEERAGEPMLRGLAVPYDKWSEDLGGFRERIAVDAARADVEGGKPIAMLWQHDPAHPISKTTARRSPLVLENTPRGVFFEQDVRSLTAEQRQRIEDGVVDQMSFGFKVRSRDDDHWEEVGKGKYQRTVLRMSLVEISPVTFPAYRQTKVAVRCAAEHGIVLPGLEEDGNLPPTATEGFLLDQERRLQLALFGETR